jgi:hypothetical protein
VFYGSISIKINFYDLLLRPRTTCARWLAAGAALKIKSLNEFIVLFYTASEHKHVSMLLSHSIPRTLALDSHTTGLMLQTCRKFLNSKQREQHTVNGPGENLSMDI